MRDAHRFHPEAVLHPDVREVYRDDVLWVLDKGAGVLSHPNPPARHSNSALLSGVYDFRNELYRFGSEKGGETEVHLVHRLDQETSGLIICAFHHSPAALLRGALSRGQIRKEYTALLLGKLRGPRATWVDRLDKSRRGGRLEVRAVRRGDPNAQTECTLDRVFSASGLVLVTLHPTTGRSHQLRVQAATRGVPIAGDARYGDFKANRFLRATIGLKRMFLHARCLELDHPGDASRLCLEAELPDGLKQSLDRLETLHEAVPRR